MIEIKKRASFVLGIISFLCSLYIGTAEAATRLTPAHLYDWARTGNITRLQQFKRYINLQDRNHNTALCLAQKAQDSNAYTLLLKFGASTKVACHDDNDPICAVIAGEKTKVSPAAWWLLGAGAAAGAYLLLDDDDDDDKCKPENGEYDNKENCEKQNPGYTCVQSGKCYIKDGPAQCEFGSTDYQSVDDCGVQGILGWSYTNHGLSGELNCGECTKLLCLSGFDSKYQSVTDCGTSGANGWNYKQDTTRYNGDTACGSCSPKECPTNTSINQICQDGNFTKGTVQNTGSYSGDNICQSCSFECDEVHAFKQEQKCQEGGYICTAIQENGQTCYRRTGSEQCPIEYPSTNPCVSADTGYTTSQDETKVGDVTCYKCTYKCASGWNTGSCPAGKVCDEIILPDRSGRCYRNEQCPSDYQYTSEATCTAGGYICSESAPGSGCWKREGDAQCPTGYDTSIQDPSDCGVGGANGWKVETSGQSGGKTCGKCVALQ